MIENPRERATRLSQRDAADLFAKHDAQLPSNWSGEVDLVDDYVAAYYELGGGAVFVEVPTLPGPVMFLANAGGRRTHVLAAREYGDVAWPAWLFQQRRLAPAIGRRIVREGMADVLAWIDASQAALAGPVEPEEPIEYVIEHRGRPEPGRVLTPPSESVFA